VKIVVSLNSQRLSVYDGMRKVAETPVSTGQSGHPTPTGIFNIIQKNKVHFSNLYNDAPMPFMQRITWSGVALHAGHLPGYRASHGCIRMPHGFASQLFGQTRIGARVVIAHDDVAPQPFAHPALFKPLPPGDQPLSAPIASRSSEFQVSMLLGVSAASAAAGLATQGPVSVRTRKIVAAERAAEIANQRSVLDLAEARHREQVERTVAANRLADDARAAARRVRQEADDINRAIERTERAKAGVEAQLATLIRRNGAATTDAGASEKLLSTEDELEARILALVHEIDALKLDLEDQAVHTPRVTAAAEAAEAVRTDAVRELQSRNAQMREAKDQLTALERAHAKRELPASIFISRKTGKIHVRQGFEPIFEAPVEIDTPEAPFGTHILTAMSYTEGEVALNWSVLTIPDAGGTVDPAARPARRARGQVAKGEPPPAPRRTFPMTAAQTLERLRLSPEAAERIAEIIKPGSSVVLSDLPISNETGKGTDFIVLTR
jgi:hypothetical protein